MKLPPLLSLSRLLAFALLSSPLAFGVEAVNTLAAPGAEYLALTNAGDAIGYKFSIEPTVVRTVTIQVWNSDVVPHNLLVTAGLFPGPTAVLGGGIGIPPAPVILLSVPPSRYAHSGDLADLEIPDYHEYRVSFDNNGLPIAVFLNGGQTYVLKVALVDNNSNTLAPGPIIRFATNGVNHNANSPATPLGTQIETRTGWSTLDPNTLGNFRLETELGHSPLDPPVLSKGDACAAVSGATFTALENPAVNSFGDTALRASIKGPSALSRSNIIMVQNSDAAVLLAQTGATAADAPGVPGAKFKTFEDPILDDLGEVAFGAHLATAAGGPTMADDYGVWCSINQTLQLALHEGDAAPGLDSTQHFVSAAWLDLAPNALFIGANTSNGASTGAVTNTGIWKWDGAILTKVVATGDQITLNGVTHVVRSFSRPSSLGTGNASSRMLSNNGKLQLLVTCTDGTVSTAAF